MCLSTAAQAARCFEASISVVTTKTGGMSSGAGVPIRYPVRVNMLVVGINKTDGDSHQ